MDPSSFFVGIGLAYGALSILILIADRPRLTAPLGMMAGAYAAIAIGVLLQARAGHLPFWLGAITGNVLAWLGLLYQGWAILGLSGRQRPTRTRVLVVVGLAGVAVLLLLLPASLRFAAGNVVYAVLFSFSAWALLGWIGAPRELRSATAALFVVSGALYIVRAVEFAMGSLPATFDRATPDPTWAGAVLYPLIFTTLISGAFSLLLLCRKCVELQLEETSARLSHLAAFDELTGLANRRSLLERARAECSRADRTGRPLTVAVLDLDRLKLINDGHGHSAGDEALRRVAAACDASFREQDIAARIGGDEFAVLLPDSDLEQGRAAMARMLTQLASQPVSAGDFTIELSASIGVVQYLPAENLDDVFARADRAMYASKKAGGATVVAAEARLR